MSKDECRSLLLVFFILGVFQIAQSRKKNIKLNFIDRLIRKSLQLHRHFCLFVVCPWANSSKCGRCRKSRLLFGKPPFERCCFHVAQIALDPNPPSSVTPLKQEIARFFSSKHVLAYTKRYNTCGTRFVPLSIWVL